MSSFLRDPDAFIRPQFWAEDGPVWFAPAFNHGFLSTLFQPYSGTIGLVPRLGAYLTTLAPLSVAPLMFTLIALACLLLPVFILCSSRLRPIVPSRLLVVALCLVYIGLPNSSDEIFLKLANVQWHLGVAALLILIAAAPTTLGWKVLISAYWSSQD